MNLILCLDDNFAMAFNGRRQSSDRAVREKILSICKDKKLYMNDYSLCQFENNKNIISCDDFLNKAENGEYCFSELDGSFSEKIEKLIVFMWNRSYPYDLKLGFDIEGSGFKLLSSEDFAGYSHEKITMKIYERSALNEE